MSLQVQKQSYFVNNSIVPQPILDFYYHIEKQFVKQNSWKNLSESDLWFELCFCILSSNVPFEQAKSATVHLNNKQFLEPYWIMENLSSLDIIARELSKPICLPKKKDGMLRKYRFPNVRAKNIVSATNFIYSKKNCLKNTLHELESESIAREFLVRNVSGLGLKEASHFLRNIGYASSLAIIDVHIISFMKELKLISGNSPITNRKYFELEEKMQKLAEFYGLNLAIFDNAIWNYMKNKQ